VINGAAATCGLNAIAALHNPAPAATTVTVNRSKIVIDIEPFIRAQPFGFQVVRQSRVPYRSRVERRR
jgi:hypothetical protein